MNQEKGSKQKVELMTNLQQQVKNQIATLTTKLPSYAELTEEEKEIVDRYISQIDLNDIQTIDKFGKNETDKIYKELDVLIGTLKTHDTSIEDMFAELMLAIDENMDSQKGGFIETLKKSPLTAMRRLKNKTKQMVANERYRRARVLTNIDTIQEKLEEIRNELRINAGKLEIMAQNSADQYNNIQYQIIALQEILRQIEKKKSEVNTLSERTFLQIDQSLQLSGVEKRVNRKIDNCKGVSINAATKAIMSRLLAQHNEELASDYDQDLSSLLPELKGIVLTAEANDSLIEAVDTHNEFVERMNEMLRTESQRSVKAMKKVQDISKGSAIETETAKVLTDNVIEIVRELRDSQKEGRATNEAFTEIMDEFRTNLTRELDNEIDENKSTYNKQDAEEIEK